MCEASVLMRNERERIRGRELDVKESQKRGQLGRGEQLRERNRTIYKNPKKGPEKLVTL